MFIGCHGQYFNLSNILKESVLHAHRSSPQVITYFCSVQSLLLKGNPWKLFFAVLLFHPDVDSGWKLAVLSLIFRECKKSVGFIWSWLSVARGKHSLSLSLSLLLSLASCDQSASQCLLTQFRWQLVVQHLPQLPGHWSLRVILFSVQAVM